MLALLMAVPFSLAATPFDPSLGSHPLQQVTTDQTGATSVDADADGVIDQAESVGAVNSDTSVGDGTTAATLKIKGATTLWSAIDFYSGASTNMWGMGRASSGDFYIDRSGVRRAFTINKDTLNVGIDTTAPSQKLDVNGYVKGTGLCIGSDCRTSWPASGVTGSGTANYLPKWSGASSQGNSVIYDNGNVGIGTTSPPVKLTVAGNLRLDDGNNDNIISGGIGGAGSINFRDNTLSGMKFNTAEVYNFQTNSATKLHISNAGNVGIGTTTPSSKLDVNGDMRSSIMYDRDNTGYYLDPASTSNVNLLYVGDLRSSGTTMTLSGGAESTYGAATVRGSKNGWSGLNFKDAAGTNYGTLMMHPFYSGFFNAADNNWRWYVDDNGNSYQYGYLYDAQNGGYYLDLAGTSRINYVVADNTYNYGWTQADVFYDRYNNGYYLQLRGTNRLNYIVADNTYTYGNENVNDIYIRAAGKWASQLVPRGTLCGAGGQGWWMDWQSWMDCQGVPVYPWSCPGGYGWVSTGYDQYSGVNRAFGSCAKQ